MTNELRTAFEWLAGEAKIRLYIFKGGRIYDTLDGGTDDLPGSDGTLADSDVSLVLTWLGDTDYVTYMSKSKPPPERVWSIWRDDMDERIREYGNTLPEALAGAVKALHRSQS